MGDIYFQVSPHPNLFPLSLHTDELCRPLDVISYVRLRRISVNLVGTTSTSSPSSVPIPVSEVRPPDPPSHSPLTISSAVQHGADLGSWFGHPSAQEDDREMHGLARHMTAYLMYAFPLSPSPHSHTPPRVQQLRSEPRSKRTRPYVPPFSPHAPPTDQTLTVRIWPQYGMDRRTLHLGRRNISVGHDDDRLDAMRFLNVQNPIFAR